MSKYKGLVLILDGLGDRPHPLLNHRTPLEAAYTPNLDRLARDGLTGFVNPLQSWVPVGTQMGASLLMGLARADIHLLLRGPVEAAGVGFNLQVGDVAVRCNFATLHPENGRLRIRDRRAGRTTDGLEELIDSLNEIPPFEGISVQFRLATQHRLVMILQGEGLSDRVSDTDPGVGFEGEGVQECVALDQDHEAAQQTARCINSIIWTGHEVLNGHPVNRVREAKGLLPANGVITRGAGQRASYRNLINHLGIRTAVVTGEKTIEGLGRLFGFDVITRSSFTGTPDTDLKEKFEVVAEALQNHDLVFLHIKGTDTTAHDQLPLEKKAFLERIDGQLGNLIDEPLVIGLTGDHSTDSSTGRHTGDPVPALLRAPTGRKDATQQFGESTCFQGGLGQLSATSFISAVLDLMNVTHIYKGHEHFYFKA